MEQIIGGFKEFIVIERKVLDELTDYAEEIKNEPGIHTQGLSKGIEYAVRKIKENNIYNKDFEIKG